MDMITTVICAAVVVLLALGFIAMGMAPANCYNKKEWKKYYEGREEAIAKAKSAR